MPRCVLNNRCRCRADVPAASGSAASWSGASSRACSPRRAGARQRPQLRNHLAHALEVGEVGHGLLVERLGERVREIAMEADPIVYARALAGKSAEAVYQLLTRTRIRLAACVRRRLTESTDGEETTPL